VLTDLVSLLNLVPSIGALEVTTSVETENRALSKVVEGYVNPLTKTPLITDSRGNLCELGSTRKILYENHDGIYDFTSKNNKNQEKEYYNGHYRTDSLKPLSIEACQGVWQKEPGFEQLLTSMGDISGRKILLVGEGVSLKELYFLWLGAQCVYTDLSIEAIKYVKAVFDRSELKRCGLDKIEFHAVDVYQPPFSDECFDIIYGCACVHHIENLDKLFAEISRCLKPGGICRFMDHAYSPLWQFLKNSVLKPLQMYAHRKRGISPADLAATKRGGYAREELEQLKKTHGFSEMLYWRVGFFEHLLQRGTSKLGGRCLRKLKPLMRALDTFLDRVACFVQKHGIVLVWGFTK
jgi:SAM-dependent methyltransferase